MESPDLVLKLVRDYVNDYTSLLQGMLNAHQSATFTMPLGNYPVSSLKVPVGLTLNVPTGATIQALAMPKVGNDSIALLTLSSRSRLEGDGVIDGNRFQRKHGSAVLIAGQANGVSVSGVRIVEAAEQGIQVVGSRGIVIDSVSVSGCGIPGTTDQYQAINLVISSDVEVRRCNLSDAQHGVQWWGDETNGLCENIIIYKNEIRDVTGGAWGHLGKNVSVVRNKIKRCKDVGVDFETTFDSESIGNEVSNCLNHALSVFNGSKNILFRGDKVNQEQEWGGGIGLYGPVANTGIRFEGGSIQTFGAAGQGLGTVGSGVASKVTLTGYSIEVNHPSAMPIRVLDANRFYIVENPLIAGYHSIGVSLEGSSDSVVKGNLLRNMNPTSGSKGVFLYWRGAQHPTKRTVVEENRLEGYEQIADDCWGDNNSCNVIRDNEVAQVTHRGTSSYTGIIQNNKTLAGSPSVVSVIS
ncbi:right-handed parallel beta-helix repeat-containing protein [Spirosoma rigui]|uniref:right-handed parallel beta-helix repeat-containing protein n=1 Tax=Spirosoma rigui TaxID=564064 RepID=UPI0009AF664F|nr:right-handed parallel beta-helix repeat-containing protein [Spirosoma rigui]